MRHQGPLCPSFSADARPTIRSLHEPLDTKKNPYGAKLYAIFGADIGHWDVVATREVTSEAYELVEHGLLDEDEFRDFTFTNAARMWGSMNPNFFKGTVVESEAAKVLAVETKRTGAKDASSTRLSDISS